MAATGSRNCVAASEAAAGYVGLQQPRPPIGAHDEVHPPTNSRRRLDDADADADADVGSCMLLLLLLLLLLPPVAAFGGGAGREVVSHGEEDEGHGSVDEPVTTS